MSSDRDLSDLVERADLLEEQAGVSIDSVYVGPSLRHESYDRFFFGSELAVYGELRALNGTNIKHDFQLVVQVYDKSWKKVHASFQKYSARKFFGLELFSIGSIEPNTNDIWKIRVFPEIVNSVAASVDFGQTANLQGGYSPDGRMVQLQARNQTCEDRLESLRQLPSVERIEAFEERLGVSMQSIKLLGDETDPASWTFVCELEFDHDVLRDRAISLIVGGYDSQGRLVSLFENQRLAVNRNRQLKSEQISGPIFAPDSVRVTKLRVFPQLRYR